MSHAAAIAASLLAPGREQAMVQLVQHHFRQPVRMLEVGVWQAAGSTRLWLEHLPAGSELVLLDAWRPYASPADLERSGEAPARWDYAQMDAQCEQAFEATLQRLRAYQRASDSHPRVRVHLVRAPAREAMAWMRDGSFDLVYVDGDHKYEQVRSDLRHACRLVRPDGGIVCGDDLERLPDAEALALARAHRQRDYLGAPHRFHPGVCLAVHECFGTVHMTEGFWWVQCHQGRFATTDGEASPTRKAA